MKITKAIGVAALVGILAASSMYVTGGIDLPTVKTLLLILTVAWFVAALLPTKPATADPA
ncbi:MAG: hypothetical protein AAF266_06040 [Planctomycetota bacterium]